LLSIWKAVENIWKVGIGLIYLVPMSAAHEGYFGTVENTKGCRTLRFTLVHETKKKGW